MIGCVATQLDPPHAHSISENTGRNDCPKSVLGIRRGLRAWLCFGDKLRSSGNLRDIPSAAQRFNQLDAGGHLQNAEIHGGLLIAQERGLSGDDVQIRVDSEAVAVHCKLEASIRRADRRILLAQLHGKNPQLGDVVLDLLERR